MIVRRPWRPWHVVIGISLAAGSARAHHVAREDPSEAIFTERAFLERNVELDVGFEHGIDGADVQETSLGATWTFGRSLQLGLDVPWQTRFPEEGGAVSGLADVGVSAQWELCCEDPTGFTYLSLRGEMISPTGDFSRAIDGNGGFALSALGAYGLTTVRAWQDLGIQVELTYSQELGLTRDERAAATSLARPRRRGQELDWNLAFTQPLLGRRLTPVLEVLGTSVLDAADPADRGTSVQLAVGVWVAPFPDDSALSPASFAAGWRWPVTQRRESQGAALLIFEWTFD